MTDTVSRAAVVGATAWGTMLAVILTRNEVATTLITRSEDEAALLRAANENARRLPGTPFPDRLRVAAGGEGIEAHSNLVVFAVPSHTLEANARKVASGIPAGAVLLSATKGIEGGTGRRMSEVLTSILPDRPVAALSGPNLSREVAEGLPGATVIASADAELEGLRSAFHTGTFRVYTSRDIVGVELGGALKNVIAIAGGMVDAFRYGDNAKASIITRGLAEMTRLGVAAGANGATFLGLSGVGDAIATSYSPLSRNRRLGEMLALGTSLEEALSRLDETAEGARTVPAALALADRLGVELPITRGLHSILYEGVSPRQAVEALLGRAPTHDWGAA